MDTATPQSFSLDSKGVHTLGRRTKAEVAASVAAQVQRDSSNPGASNVLH